jgi:hypothetical protein
VPDSALATYNNWGTQGSDTCGGGTSAAGKTSTTFGATWSWGSRNCTTKRVYMCRMAPPGEFHYTSATYKSEYVLNSQPTTFSNANSQCQVSVWHGSRSHRAYPHAQQLAGRVTLPGALATSH